MHRSRMPISLSTTATMASVSQRHRPRIQSWQCTTLFLFVAVFASLFSSAAAAIPPRIVVDTTTLVIPRSSTTTGNSPAAETLVRDDRMPVLKNGGWTFLSHDEVVELRKRDEDGSAVTTVHETTTAAAHTKTTLHETDTATESAEASASTDTGTGTSTGSETSTSTTTKTASASPLPSFFDSSLASNFSSDSACPSFINSFLTNPTFKKCYPFSLLLQVCS